MPFLLIRTVALSPVSGLIKSDLETIIYQGRQLSIFYNMYTREKMNHEPFKWDQDEK
jgi:hypothetical protein